MFTAIDTLVNGRERFRAHQIEYKLSEKNKSEIYRDALPGLNSGKFELLDHPKLVAQICALERRTARGGRDSIDHPPKQHDDLANSALDAAGSTPRSSGVSSRSSTSPVRISTMSLASWFVSRGRFWPLGSVGIFPTSISTQHALKKADLLCDYSDRLHFRQRLGNWSPGINRF
jgi:hypothetical protein